MIGTFFQRGEKDPYTLIMKKKVPSKPLNHKGGRMTWTHKQSRRLLPILIAVALFIPSTTTPVWAGGGQHYPNGLTDFMSGVLPPPGFYWLNYLTYISKDKLADRDGNEIGDFKASVIAEVPRFVYMTPHKILGATWGAQVIIPLYAADAKLNVGPVQVFDSDEKGVGDIIFSPFLLAWHFSPNFHAGFAVDIWAPTGNYDKNEPASQILSRNHWTFEPVFAASYWVPGGIDVSAKFMYDINTKNDDVLGAAEVKPGQEFHFDWGVSHALGKEDMRLGLTGFYYRQTSDDEVNGIEQDSGLRSKLAALGVAFKWWPGMGKFNLTAKYLKDFSGENIVQGQSFWINTVYAF